MKDNVITKVEGIKMGLNKNTVCIDVENTNGADNNINVSLDIETAIQLFNSCRYNEAEQIFSRIKGHNVAAWRILCYIVRGDIGKKGGKISTLLQETEKNQDASIEDTIMSLQLLTKEYESAIDRKTRNKVNILLSDVFDDIMKGRMAVTISDINKKAIDIVRKKGYNPSIHDDKTIPLQVLNRKLKKHKYRIRHYKTEDISSVLKIIKDEKFLQEIVDEYISMGHSSIISIKEDYLDTRNPDILKYIRSLYISNIANEKELRFTRSMDKLTFIDTLNKLSEKGWVRITMLCAENTKYFNMANDEDKAMLEIEIERASEVSIVTSMIYENIIEKRGYLLYDGTVNQMSKEDIAIGDATNRYTRQYVGPMPGTIYHDN